MSALEIALFVIGIVLLVVGYRRNHRNLMLAAAIALLAAGTVPDFVSGLRDGVRGAATAAT